MGVKYEDILEANANIPTIPVKGKNYVMVNERVKAFRKICPGGTISTEIISLNDDVVVMKATVSDGESILATGFAFEKRESSFINKTSYIENCETSAVGRALGFAGIGIDDSMGSADEVANALQHQEEMKMQEVAKRTISAVTFRALTERCNAEGVDIQKLCEKHKIHGLEELTEAQHSGIINNWGKVLEVCRKTN